MTCLQRNKSAAEENIVLQRIVSREITVSEYICFLTALKQVQRKALEEWNTRLESMHKGDRDKYGLV